MKNDDLILKGNQLINAAREGKIGLVADEIAALQKAYIQNSKLTPTVRKMQIFGGGLGCFGASLVFLASIFEGGDFITLIFSIVAGLGGLSALATPFVLGRKTKEYADLIAREYPRIDGRKAV